VKPSFKSVRSILRVSRKRPTEQQKQRETTVRSAVRTKENCRVKKAGEGLTSPYLIDLAPPTSAYDQWNCLGLMHQVIDEFHKEFCLEKF
jgi:hypothetical protein